MNKLKPCPFCGAIPRVVGIGKQTGEKYVYYYIECQGMTCPMYTVATGEHDIKEDAVAAWNLRTKEAK